MAVGADRLPHPGAVSGTAVTLAVRRVALWGLLVAKLVGGWGVQWDIQWHVLVGRDSFWIPPHVMTYAGVSLVVLLSFGVLAWETLRASRAAGGAAAASGIRLVGLTGTRGFHLAAWGIAITVMAAPIDDLWHRLFGLDVTLWSPPHLLGIFGAVVNSIACLLIICEVYPAGRLARLVALVAAGGLLYGNVHLAVQPANLVAYRYGGVFFFTLPALSALLLPSALVPTARLSAERWAPVLLLLVIILVGMAGQRIASVGFEVLQPISTIEEGIAKDPRSPVALATIIARKQGSTPGRTGGLLHSLSLLPVLVMALIDARRRPLAATAGYALSLFLVSTWLLARSVAFGPLVPGAAETLTGLALTLAAALAGGFVARVISNALAPPGAEAAGPTAQNSRTSPPWIV